MLEEEQLKKIYRAIPNKVGSIILTHNLKMFIIDLLEVKISEKISQITKL